MFWRAFYTWLAQCKIRMESYILDVLLGVYKKGEDFKILDHLILSAKFYIYKCKLSGVNPSLQVFKVKTKAVHQIESGTNLKNTMRSGGSLRHVLANKLLNKVTTISKAYPSIC